MEKKLKKSKSKTRNIVREKGLSYTFGNRHILVNPQNSKYNLSVNYAKAPQLAMA